MPQLAASTAEEGSASPKQVFLSYAREDDESFVQRLYSDLTEAGFDVWWDRKRMPSRALTFLQEIRDAIDLSDRLIAVVGPVAVRSDYVRSEWMHALLFSRGVVPLLRIGKGATGYELLPDELSLYHCPDFREQRPYQEALEELVRILREPLPPLASFLTPVPALPPHFVPRRQNLADLEKMVLADVRQPVVITSAKRLTAVFGMGGIGKSMLAAAFVRSAQVRRSFSDGIVWIDIGPNPEQLRTLRTLGQAFNDTALMRSIDLNDARAKLPRTLESRNTLLVLDDVWDVEHVSALANAAGPRCRILMTTRDGSIATSFGAREHSVDLLSNQTARLLLASWVEVSEPDLPAEARQVMLECGNLPLALALCGAMVRDGTPWQDVVQALRSADLTFVEAKLPNYEYPNMLRALQTSVDMLSRDEPDAVARYLELATFREERAVPEAAVITLWCRHGILSEAGSRKLLTKLARKSLLRIETEQPLGGAFRGRTISLHDLQYDYVYARNENAAELRAALLGAYREKCAGDWWSCPADGYFHLRLMGLLHEVEGAKACRRLLLDFRWLDAKTRATDIAELLQDFAFGEPADGVVSAIERALRHAAHLLTFGEGANQLGSQLMARLLGQNEPEINRLCEQAHQVRSAAGGPWLRPLTASLREPSALLRTLAAHAGGVTALAVLPDGRLLSGGADKTIRIWNIETGKAEAALAGHTGTVWALTLLPDGRVASGCGDDTVDLWMNYNRLPGDTTDHHVIKIWNLLTGRAESTLCGHTGTVWALVPLPEGRLASGSPDGSMKIWNLRTEEVEREMAEFVSALALAPDGRLLSLSWGSAKLWDWRTGEAHEIVDDYHGSPLVPLTMLPGGMFALGRNDHSIGIIDLDGSYRTNWRVPLPADSSVSVLAGAFRRNLVGHTSWVSALTGLQGGRLASGSKDGTIKLWNLTTATVEATLHAHSTRVTALAALPGKRLASASLDGTIRFWNVAGTEFEQALDKHERSVRTLLLLPDGRMAAGTDDGIIGLWNVAARRLETKLAGHTSSVRALLMLSPETLLSGSWDATVRVWNLKTGETEAIIKTTDAGWGREVNALAMLGGKRLAAACGDKTVKVWNLQSSETEPPLPHLEYVLCLLPLDEQRLFSGGGGDCAIRLWNLETRQVEVVLRGHSSDVSTLAMARDGRLLSGSWDATMRIWTPGIAESLQPLVGHTDAIWAVLPLADGSIISASRDGTIRLWSEGEGGWKSAPVFIAGSGVTSLLLIESSAVVVAGDASGRVHFLRLEH